VQLEELNREIERCTRCRLSETRTHALCGEGNVNAKLFLVAQAPGENEDREGKMFIGPSGKVLDGLFASIGMEKHTFYMTNLVKCMLPHCRKPKQDEIEACSRYLDREIEIIGSEVLVPLGYYATKYLFEKYTLAEGTRAEFKDVYGKVLYQSGKNILPLPHPAVLIHTPSLRKAVTENYRKLKVVSADCK